MIKNSKMLLDIFRGLTDSEPKDTTLEELVHLITDDASVRDLTDKYRYYLSTGDERQARRFKELLPCFAVAVRFSGGKHKRNICAYTGLTIVDIDHVPAEKMQQVLALVREDPHTLLAYTTVSGLGVRVIARFVLNTSNDLKVRGFRVRPNIPRFVGANRCVRPVAYPRVHLGRHIGLPLR